MANIITGLNYRDSVTMGMANLMATVSMDIIARLSYCNSNISVTLGPADRMATLSMGSLLCLT